MMLGHPGGDVCEAGFNPSCDPRISRGEQQVQLRVVRVAVVGEAMGGDDACTVRWCTGKRGGTEPCETPVERWQGPDTLPSQETW